MWALTVGWVRWRHWAAREKLLFSTTAVNTSSCFISMFPHSLPASVETKKTRHRKLRRLVWREYVGIEPTWAALHHLHRF